MHVKIKSNTFCCFIDVKTKFFKAPTSCLLTLRHSFLSCLSPGPYHLKNFDTLSYKSYSLSVNTPSLIMSYDLIRSYLGKICGKKQIKFLQATKRFTVNCFFDRFFSCQSIFPNLFFQQKLMLSMDQKQGMTALFLKAEWEILLSHKNESE